MAEVATLKLRIDSREAKTAASDLDRLGKAGKRAETSANSLTSAYRFLGRAAGTIGASLVAREVIQAADAYKNLNARLQLVSKSASEFVRAQQAVFDISQRTRIGLGQTGDLYTSLARSTESLGVSQNDLLQVTESINKALIISGTSASSAQAALVQLGQGFSSGVLRGEELNSVLEQAPRLARALADGLGVPIGKLRELGQAGELTADKVFRALQKSGSALDGEFKRLPLTVEQASVQAANSLSRLIGVIDTATGATGLLARALSGISRGTDGLSNLPQTISLGSLAKDLNNANTELKRLQALKASPFAGLVPDLEKQLAIAQQKFEAARRTFKIADGRLGVGGPGDQTSAEARRLGLTGPTPTPSAGKPTKPPRSLGGGGSVVDEAEQYLKSLRSQFEATADLSVQETLLRDLQLGRLGKVTAAQEQELLGLAKQIDGFKALQDEEQLQAKRTADALAERNRVLEDGRALYDATRTPLEALAIETDRLNKLLQAGAIDWDTYSRAIFAAQDEFDSINKKANETGTELDKFAERAAEKIQSALGDELTNILEGDFDSIGDSFTKVINRMVAEAIAADLARAIGLGGGSGGGDIFGGLIKTGLSFFGGGGGGFGSGSSFGNQDLGLNFEGGGYTGSGSRIGGLDGKGGFMAMVHPDETVIDHTKGGSEGRQLIVNQTINVMPGATRQTSMQAAADASRKLQQAQRNL